MHFDLHSVPFSHAGATLAFRIPQPTKDGGENLELQLGRDFLIAGLQRDGTPVSYDYVADPAGLVLTPCQGQGRVECIFETPSTLRIRSSGVALHLEMLPGTWGQVLVRGLDHWQINHFGTREQVLLTRLAGSVGVDAPWDGVRAKHVHITITGEVALETFSTTAPADRERPTLVQCRRQVQAEFSSFLAALPAVPPRYRATRELAGYVLWSAIIAPQGNFQRSAMLMSKNRMTSVWSWDHCFNALALTAAHPALAWDQLHVMFDHQDRHGALPDCLSSDRMIWNFCKPPIHGWTLRRMLESPGHGITRRQLADFYPKLAAWTQWWLDSRDDDGDGICQYHHGNDSGWDNATCFTIDMPIEGPDLAAFLITQMGMLADLAKRLGSRTAAARWRRRADRMMHDMIRHFWRGNRFVAMQSGTHRSPECGDSLIPFIPLMLGKQLPSDLARSLVEGLFEPGRFLTPYGLATESLRSPLYKADGYWRGPIWAPSTFIIHDGLCRLGEHQRARDVAQRFCEACRLSGLPENFDALSGAPQCDKAYTWTASVFLLLANSLLEDHAG